MGFAARKSRRMQTSSEMSLCKNVMIPSPSSSSYPSRSASRQRVACVDGELDTEIVSNRDAEGALFFEVLIEGAYESLAVDRPELRQSAGGFIGVVEILLLAFRFLGIAHT